MASILRIGGLYYVRDPFRSFSAFSVHENLGAGRKMAVFLEVASKERKTTPPERKAKNSNLKKLGSGRVKFSTDKLLQQEGTPVYEPGGV